MEEIREDGAEERNRKKSIAKSNGSIKEEDEEDEK